MAKSRKKKNEINEELIFEKQPEVGETFEEYSPCEWVIQFDNDPPIRFAYMDENSTDKEVVITLPNNSNSFLSFENPDSNKSFKIFARKPLS